MNAHACHIQVSDKLIESITERQKAYLYELRDKYGYNLQYFIE